MTSCLSPGKWQNWALNLFLGQCSRDGRWTGEAFMFTQLNPHPPSLFPTSCPYKQMLQETD